MKTSEFIMANRAAPDQGRTLGQVLARAEMAREEPEAGVLPLEEQLEENALRYLAARYQPGQLSALAMALGDVTAEIEDERAKLAAGAKRQQLLMQRFSAGHLSAWDMQAMSDGDFGDEGRLDQLERKAARLRGQISAANESVTAVAQRARADGGEDGVEAASRRAHQAFTEATRAMMAEAESGAWRARREPRPFAGRGSAAAGDECPGPDCEVCAEGRRMDAAREGAQRAEISRAGSVRCDCGTPGCYV